MWGKVEDVPRLHNNVLLLYTAVGGGVRLMMTVRITYEYSADLAGGVVNLMAA